MHETLGSTDQTESGLKSRNVHALGHYFFQSRKSLKQFSRIPWDTPSILLAVPGPAPVVPGIKPRVSVSKQILQSFELALQTRRTPPKYQAKRI